MPLLKLLPALSLEPDTIHINGKMTSLGAEHMLWVRIGWQDLTWSCGQKDGTSPGLSNAKVAGLQDTKGTLNTISIISFKIYILTF